MPATARPHHSRPLALGLSAVALAAAMALGAGSAGAQGSSAAAADDRVQAVDAAERARLLTPVEDDGASTAVVPLAVGAVTLGWLGLYTVHRKERDALLPVAR